MSAPLIDVDDLIEFIDELRLAGYDISTQQYIGAQNLLLALAANGHLPSDPRALQTWLAPVLCSSPREQNNFYRRFDRWITQHPMFAEAKAAQKQLDKDQASIEEAERRDWRSTLIQAKYLVPLLALLVIIAGFIFVPPLIPRTLTGKVVDNDSKVPLTDAKISFGDNTTVSDSSGGFSISYRSKQLPANLIAEYPEYETATLRVDANSQSPLVVNLQQLVPTPDPSPTPDPPPSPSASVTVTPNVTPIPTPTEPVTVTFNRLKWVRYGGAILPLFLFGVWLLWEKKLSNALLKKLRSATQPHLDQIIVKGAAGQLFLGQSFRRTIQELRRHRQRGARELDASGTVHRTIEKGGLFSPFYGLRQTLPEYLVLIDRASFQDQQARLEEELIRRLVQENVFVDSYYFQGDPRTCRTPGKDTRFVTLQEMAALHPDHHLIIFSDGSTFLNPVSGAPESWLEMFSPWAKRALLTPEPAAQWGYREWVLAELDFIVLPATKEGLAALTELIDGGTSALLDRSQRARPFPPLLRERPRRWLDNHEPAPEIANQLCDQLKLFLGSKGYFWLSACSIYPVLYWDLTLYLGFKLFSDRAEIEERLLSLVRLPWFRYGTLPDWLRTKLSSELPQEDNLRIRRILEELFLTVLQKPSEGIRLDIASGKGESRLKRWLNSWKFKRFLRQALKEEQPESPLRDYVFLSFMSGRKPRKLTVSVPDSIRRVFFPQGQFALGMRPLSALVLAAICSLGVFFMVRPSEAVRTIESDLTDLNGQLVVTASVDNTARVWDAATGQQLIELLGHSDSVWRAKFSPDGKYIVTASADKFARLWDSATGRIVRVLTGHSGSLRSADFSPDAKLIVTAGDDKTARVWDVATGRMMMELRGHTDYVWSVAFSPDGRYIVTGGDDKSARVWDTATGQEVLVLSGDMAAVSCAVFSPDGKHIVTASLDSTARLWEAATGQLLMVFRGHTSDVYSAAFSPDGKYIVTASKDMTAQVWDVATGRIVLVLSGHTSSLLRAAYSPDGKYIVTASEDKTARVWEVASGRTVTELRGHTDTVLSAAFRPLVRSADAPVLPDVDQPIADLIAKFAGDERRSASDQLIELYEQNKAAVVKALIDGIQGGPDSYRVNLYIARTLGSIRPNWEGTAEQLARVEALKGTRDYQDATFKGWVDKAISNFSQIPIINPTPTPQPSPSPTPSGVPSFVFTVNLTRAVVNQPVLFTLNVTPRTTAYYTINFGDGSSNSVGSGRVTHRFSVAGTYKVTAVATLTDSAIPVISKSAIVVVTEAATVPNLIGMSVDSAQKVVIGDLLSIGKVTERETSGQADGVVISQSPNAGALVARYTRVNIVVARKAAAAPVEQSQVVVPNVLGQDLYSADKILSGAGLKARFRGREGVVLAQDPRSGTRVPLGTTVTLTLKSKLPTVN